MLPGRRSATGGGADPTTYRVCGDHGVETATMAQSLSRRLSLCQWQFADAPVDVDFSRRRRQFRATDTTSLTGLIYR